MFQFEIAASAWRGHRRANFMIIIGLDIGTQSLKAVAASRDLHALGSASVTYPYQAPASGQAEQDPELWLRALRPAIAGCLQAAGARPEDVAGIGFVGQLDGCIAVDQACQALGPALIWMDRRAQDEIRDICATLVRSRTGSVLDPSHMAAKIRWLKRRLDPAKVARFHQPVSFVVERLTGRAIFDHGLASTTMLYDLDAGCFSAPLLASFGICEAELPEIGEASACAGRLTAAGSDLTGLPAGIPVAVGTGDDFAGPLGAGIVTPGTVVCSLGTAEVIGAIHPHPLIDPSNLVETHGYVSGFFFIENPGWLSGGAVTWAMRLLGIADAEGFDRAAAAVSAGSEGVIFIPALGGAMAPVWQPDARGTFYGLTAHHHQGHLARAVLEGCAFAMRDVVTRLRELGVSADRVLQVGGGARSRLWAEIRAGVLGHGVECAESVDAAPMAAVLLAATAAGLEPSLVEAAARLPLPTTRFDPILTDIPAYEQAYRRYLALFEALTPLF
jgi:xylulokinase